MYRFYKSVISFFLLIIIFTAIAGCSMPRSSDKNMPTTTQNLLQERENNAYDLDGSVVKIGEFLSNGKGSSYTDKWIEKYNDIERRYNCKLEWVDLAKGVSFRELYENLDEYHEKVFSGYEIPDIMLISSHNYIPYISKGYLIPLDEYIDYNAKPYNHPVQDSSLWNSKHYGIVSRNALNISMLYYNESIFKQMGLPDAFELQQKGQWTWDTFLDIVKVATCDISGDGVIDQWGFAVMKNAIVDTGYMLKQLAYSNGVPYVQSENGSTLFSLDQPGAVEAMEFLNDLYNTHKVIKEFDIESGITVQQIAVSPSSSNNLTGVFWPKGPKAEDYAPTSVPSEFYAVTSSAKNPEAITCILKELESPYSPDFSRDDPKNAIFNSNITTSKSNTTSGRGQLIAKIDHFDKYQPLQKLLSDTVDNIIENNLPPATIMDIKAQAQKVIDEYIGVNN